MANEIQGVTLKIQRGQGLTQALLAHVKKEEMEMSDGSINGAEWNKTIDKLIEIQEKRKADNKESIFTGGTDRKDFKTSFVIHPDQEIEFTKEEMSELYKTMGVSFTSNNTEETADTGEPDSEVTEEVKNENDEKIGTLTKKYDENGRLSNEVEKNNDGKKVNETLYLRDDEGNLTNKRVRVFDENEKHLTTKNYDADGNLLNFLFNMKYREDGTLESYTHVDYDENGNAKTVSEYEFDANENTTKIISHGANGAPIEVPIDGDGNESGATKKYGRIEYYYEYDENDNLVKECQKKFDENGRIKEIEIHSNYNEDGSYDTTIKEYDETGREIQS